MTYDEFVTRYAAAKARIIADYNSLTRAQRTGKARSTRIAEIRSARANLNMAGSISLERLGLTADEARALAYDGRVVCAPDRHRKLVGAHPRDRRAVTVLV